MGWLYGWDSKQELIENSIDPREYATAKILKHRLVGNHLWMALKNKGYSQEPWATIYLHLIACDQGRWGYKDMTESAGPSYYDCPMSIIKLVESTEGGEPPNEYASRWRAECREYAARKKENNKPKVAGTVVELCGIQYTLVRKLAPRHGWIVLSTKDNLEYRMAAKHVNQAKILTSPDAYLL